MGWNAKKATCWLLIAAMLHSGVAGCSKPPAAMNDASPSRPGEGRSLASRAIDMSYLTPEATAAVVAFPRRVLTAPGMEMLPVEVITAAGLKELGFDPMQVEQVLFLAEAPRDDQPPQGGAALRFAVAVPEKGLLPMLAEQTAPADLNGKPYRQARNPMFPSVFRADDRTLIIAHDDLLRRMVKNAAAPKAGPVGKLLTKLPAAPDLALAVDVASVRELASAQLQMAPLPPPLEDLKRVPELLAAVEATANLTGEMAMSLTLRARDEATAAELGKIIDGLLATAQQMLDAQMGQMPAGDDPVEKAARQYAQRISGQMIEALRPQRDRDSFRLATKGQANMHAATIGVLVALLLPAVQAAREAGRRAQSANNLHQIAIALLQHEAKFGEFPARASFDAQGKPLLSWRVHLLPYLDQQALYKQFKLDEPWDSPANRALIARMPSIYQNPSAPPAPGKAHYLAVRGKGTLFEGDKPRKIGEIQDGASRTIAVVEVDPERAVEWTKPEDWESDPDRPLAGLGRAHANGFGAAFCDGHVQFLSRNMDAAVFKMLLTIAGGETPPGGLDF